MTLRSFSFSRMIVAVISVLVTLTACGSGTTKLPGTTKTGGPSRTSSTTTPPVAPAPIARAAPVPSDLECQLITQAEATTALGFNPRPAHIDNSGVLATTDKMCAWGDPVSYNSKPFIDLSVTKYPSQAAAKTAFATKHAHNLAAYNPGAVVTEAIGDGAEIIPTADAADVSVVSREWIVRIQAYLPKGSIDTNHSIANNLARAVVSHLPRV
jgi:hypothetical protein